MTVAALIRQLQKLPQEYAALVTVQAFAQVEQRDYTWEISNEVEEDPFADPMNGFVYIPVKITLVQED